MTTKEQQAIILLLEDEDFSTVELIKKGLIEHQGDQLLGVYESMLDQCEGSAFTHLQDVIKQIKNGRTLGRVSRQLANLKTYEDLESLCWDLAQAEHPDLDPQPYRDQLDWWGETLRSYLKPKATPEDQVRALVRLLAYEERLGGNHTDYYHPRNGYLPWVIEFRQGLPLTLTLVYILVGRRAGLKVEGISAPGHFLARIGSIYFDPYYNGRFISLDEWRRICSEVSEAHRATLEAACTPLQMVHRLLINLRNAYLKRNGVNRQKQIDQYLAVLQH